MSVLTSWSQAEAKINTVKLRPLHGHQRHRVKCPHYRDVRMLEVGTELNFETSQQKAACTTILF